MIERASKLTVDGVTQKLKDKSLSNHVFNLMDATDFCKLGIEAVIEDEVTKCFAAEGTCLVSEEIADY